MDTSFKTVRIFLCGRSILSYLSNETKMADLRKPKKKIEFESKAVMGSRDGKTVSQNIYLEVTMYLQTLKYSGVLEYMLN